MSATPHRSLGPACGNNPNFQMADGDRQAVERSRTYLQQRAELRDRIAAALYERERPPRDPAWADAYAMDREVFEAMADAVLPAVLSEPTDQAARSERYACAVRTAGGTAYGSRPFYEAITAAVIAVADAELAAVRAAALREAADWYAQQGKTVLAASQVAADLHRRAGGDAPLSPYYEHPECGFHWHGRDGMDIPMRDGQPVCPRCELRRLHADTRTPLSEHVCEAQAVGDCLPPAGPAAPAKGEA